MSTTADTSRANPTIRSARLSNADRVFTLLKQVTESYAPDRTAFDDTFARLVAADSSSLFIVAEDAAGFVLGYALTTISPLLHANGSSAQLQELAVDSEHRGTGIGTELIETVERTCRAQGVRQLTVPTRRSADFYERLGYRSSADLLKRTFD